MCTNVADPDPVGSIPFWSDPDPDVNSNLFLINDPISTFLACKKVR
jgi:hypothetical protein